jgi:hypothetical protein
MDVVVLRLRPLNQEERSAMAGKLKCEDPLMADVRPNQALRILLAAALGVKVENLPEVISWVFSRTASCFDRRGQPNAQEFEHVDEAIRRASGRTEE